MARLHAGRGHVVSFGVITALLLGACGGGPAAQPAATQPTQAAKTVAATAAAPTAAATFSPALLGKPEVTHVKIGSATLEANNMLPQFAIDAGLFKKYGLTAEVINFEGAQRVLQAAVSGQVDMLTESPNVSMTSQTTNAPIQTIAAFTNRFLDCILTKPTITNAETLKGKKMAISSRGGQSHAEVILALKTYNLSEKDVQVVEIGGESARVSALQAGSVDAIPVECSRAGTLVQQAGFRILQRLPEITTPWVGSGMQAPKSFIDKNPNTTLAVLATQLEAMQLLFTDEAAAVKSLSAWGRIDAAKAKSDITEFKKVAQRDLRWTIEGLKTVLEVQVIGNPAVASVDVTKVSNSTFLDKLKDLGLNKQLQVP